MKTGLVQLPIATRDGIFLAHYSDRGLSELDFPNPDGLILSPDVAASGRPLKKQIRDWHRLTAAALKSILAGRAPKTLPPLDWTGHTEFQTSVWRQMLKLGPGKTKSYGEIAAAIGKPKAVRAVGGACGANPIPVLVPCHRILAANHKIGGFSSGLAWKRKLLAREGVNLDEADCPSPNNSRQSKIPMKSFSLLK
jgi:O-6-methylguanine DNA methyltransferase